MKVRRTSYNVCYTKLLRAKKSKADEGIAIGKIEPKKIEANPSQIPDIDTGLICFVMMARYFEKVADPDQLKHKYDRQNRKFDDIDLLRVAKEFSLKARIINTSWDRLAKTPLPAIAHDVNGDYFILAQVSEDKVRNNFV